MGRPNRRAIGPLLTAVLAAAPALSDEIHLVGGGRVSGRVVERTATRVAIETGPGRVTLPLSRVERIVEGRSALETFAERAAELEAGDVAGWAELARWAEERNLLTQARLAWQRVLATDPGHPEANSALGRVQLDGTWMSADDAYRSRGYVPYAGRWLTPAEHEAAVREREADEAAALGQREADLRVREAEARVREAEARAREAEAAAEESTATGMALVGSCRHTFRTTLRELCSPSVLGDTDPSRDRRRSGLRHPLQRPFPQRGCRPSPPSVARARCSRRSSSRPRSVDFRLIFAYARFEGRLCT
jgi:hypothetical protein